MSKIFTANIITMFPEIFPGSLGVSVLGRALQNKLWKLNTCNLRDFTQNTRVDDMPYGGGPGMIIRPDVLGRAIDKISTEEPNLEKLIYLSPRGKTLTQKLVKEYSKLNNIALICGRFEGIDQRVIELYHLEEVSIGEYVVSGGEVAALVFLESVVRLLPGVLGNCVSAKVDSFSFLNVLEYNQYTRPSVWRSKAVPKVLLSGNHLEIEKWKKNNSLEVTQKRKK